MILSYNWQILETIPFDLQELKSIVKMPVPEQQQFFSPQSPSNTIQPISIRLPLFGFLFCYYIQQPKVNAPQIQLMVEAGLLQQPLALRVVREMRCNGCIFLQLLLENSEMHDMLLALTVRVKYHPASKPSRIENIDNLVRLAGNRQLKLHSAATYATIRKEFIIDTPVSIQHRRKEGFLLLRLTRSEQCTEAVEILSVEVMNWLAVGSEAAKREVVVGLLNGPFILRSKETYALAFKMEVSLVGVELPVAVSYCFAGESRVFKMVKTIRGENSQ